MLSVVDGIDEAIAELLDCAEQIGLDKGDHAVVLLEIVLQGRAGEHNAALGGHLAHGLGDLGLLGLEYVSLVADDEVGAGRAQVLVEPLGRLGLSLAVVDERGEDGIAHDAHAALLEPALELNLTRVDGALAQVVGHLEQVELVLARARPLGELGAPIGEHVLGHKDEHSLGERLVAVREQRVHQGDHLERLAEAHAVGEHAAVALVALLDHADHVVAGVPHKLNAVELVLLEHARKLLVHSDERLLSHRVHVETERLHNVRRLLAAAYGRDAACRCDRGCRCFVACHRRNRILRQVLQLVLHAHALLLLESLLKLVLGEERFASLLLELLVAYDFSNLAVRSRYSLVSFQGYCLLLRHVATVAVFCTF